MKCVGTWNAVKVYKMSDAEFTKKASQWKLDIDCYYMIERKNYIIDFGGDCWIAIGQLEPNGTVFEYASPFIFYTPPTTKRKKKEIKEVEVIDKDKEFETMMESVDEFLIRMSKREIYKEIMFKGEV